MKLEGGCLCGDVRYEAGALTGPIGHCHCPTCRKAHGSAFSTVGRTSREGFRWVRGQEHVRAFESSPGKFRHFCCNCGSHMMAEWDGEPEVILRLGTLDTDPGARPAAHVWTDLKADWYEIDAKLPQIPQGRTRPEAQRESSA
ncbi:MAG: GFA family protein [Proteobacteria bacterium]|nr:GFA family protein [Pseudomonadota bacterium]